MRWLRRVRRRRHDDGGSRCGKRSRVGAFAVPCFSRDPAAPMREQLLRSTRAVRFVALALLLPVATACTSTSNVPGGGLGSIKHGVVYDHEGDEVRIDANSDVRFQRTDGSWTPWRHAASLWVSDDGVLVPYSAEVTEL